jgi:tetratricopeptide (TPR) repeat protein/predicted Ser/Thr protein kinase
MAEPSSRRVEELFDQAVDLEPTQQAAFLVEQCAGDVNLRAAVEAFLELDRKAQADDSQLRSPLADSRPKIFAPAGPLLPTVGRYRVLRVLGEGGMGTVYEAEQDNPRRTVALKVIRPGLTSDFLLKRFAREAQILGRLHHPGIAQVYDAGIAQGGQPYFAMELIAGVPLDRYAHEQGLDERGQLELVARVCDAVQHAHERGVIHRDLKPGNLLVEASGQPKVLDFGVARAADLGLTADGRTEMGQLIGTLRYMSPEQASGDPAALDARGDVYALGVILYELLAGRLPYSLDGMPLPEAARVIRDQEPSRLGSLNGRLRGDVETIVAKALEKDRDRRYPSAAELATDIRRYLSHEPIRARPPSALYHFRKFARRHKALVATTVAFLTLLLGGGAVTAWQAVKLARAERDQAVRSQQAHEALDRAGVLREQARAGADPGKWAEAREEARRAEALAEGGLVEPRLAEQIGILLREMNEEEADRRLVAHLEAVRLLQAEVNVKANLFARERALPEYRKVFADYGLRAGEAPEEAAARIRRRPPGVRDPAVAALGQWLDLARREKAPEAGWLEQMLAAADPDDWRQRLRAARGRRDRQALEDLAREVKVGAQPAQALVLLGEALIASRSTDGAVELLRRAWDAYPGDFWVNEDLGRALEASRPPHLDEAIRFYTVAVALRPSSPGAHINLGSALQTKGQLDEAIACYRKASELDPNYNAAHTALGAALQARGRLDEAIACYRKAIELDPSYSSPHYYLGLALRDKGQLDEAIPCYRKAIELDPKYPLTHYDLGNALRDKGQSDEAIACYRKAIELDPKYAPAHTNLGFALQAGGQLDEAIACFKKAIELDPKNAAAHLNLGTVLARQGDLAGAAACLRHLTELDPKNTTARLNLGTVLEWQGDLPGAAACLHSLTELDPKSASAHYVLGHVRHCQGDLSGAIASYRRAVALDPKYAEAHCNLGNSLVEQGHFRAALAELRTGHDLGSRRKDWTYRSANWVERCERFLELDGRLPAILKGDAQPDGAAERRELAELCHYKRLHATSVRFFREAFAADANLADEFRVPTSFRYLAASSAAQAGCGQDEDAARSDEAGRARMRRQALEWLQADLARQASRLEAQPQDRAALLSMLGRWQNDHDLAGVRDARSLTRLPAAERAGWEKLWADVAAVLVAARKTK